MRVYKHSFLADANEIVSLFDIVLCNCILFCYQAKELQEMCLELPLFFIL